MTIDEVEALIKVKTRNKVRIHRLEERDGRLRRLSELSCLISFAARSISAFFGRQLLSLSCASILIVGMSKNAYAKNQVVDHELLIVPASKLPVQARQGVAIMLHLETNSSTLYLYLEELDGRHVDIFDISDPRRLKHKSTVDTGPHGVFDFVQPIGQHTELIRYRDGSGVATLDLHKPTHPIIRPLLSFAREPYVLPVLEARSEQSSKLMATKEDYQDYQVIDSDQSRVIATIKGVTEEQIDGAHGTVYLLSESGLTVIRNLKVEGDFDALTRPWTNTYDDDY